jgi:hypothetical protein
VNSLGENSPAKLGTIATVVAVANATTNKLTKGQLDDLTIMMVCSFIYYLYKGVLC